MQVKPLRRKELDRFGSQAYNSPPSLRFRESSRVTRERIHMATSKSNSGKKRWTLLAAGTAVILLTAGVLLQVTRPPSAFPEETNAAAGRSAQPQGKSSSSDAAQMATMRVARVGNQFITWQELANECISRHGKDILDNLINRKIIQQACDNEGIEVSEA